MQDGPSEAEQHGSIYNSKALIIAVIMDINKFNYETNSQRQCHYRVGENRDRR